MNIWERIGQIFVGKKAVEPVVSLPNPELSIGRQIKDYNLFGSDRMLVSSSFSLQWLEVLEELAIHDPYFSKAIDNIQLGNTEYQTYFDDNISADLISEMQTLLNAKREKWYQGGFEALKNALFRQVAVSGAISAEILPFENLSGVKNIILVNAKEIRLVQTIDGTFYPVQVGEDYTVQLKEGYYYKPLETSDTSPYAIPPFISAVRSNQILNRMFINLDAMIEKIGLGGFLSVLVSRPQPFNGESQQMYQTRLEEYINRVYEQVKGGFQQGMAVGFAGDHQIGLSATNLNISSAAGVLDIFKKIQFAGLKQDGNMFGEQTGITETFGRVVLAVLSRSIEKVQKVVAAFISQIEKYELLMNGYNPDYVRGEFSKPMIGDEAKVYQADQIKIANIKEKLMLGIIGIGQAAQELGYDSAFAESNPAPVEQTSEKEPEKPKTTKVKDDVTGERRKASLAFAVHKPYFQYDLPKIYEEQDVLGFVSFGNKDYDSQSERYYEAVQSLYQRSCKKGAKDVQKRAKERDFDGQSDFVNKMLNTFVQSYQSEFNANLPNVINPYILSLYETGRKDKSIFRKKTKQSLSFADPTPDIPLAMFNLNDYQLIDFLQGMDTFYLGKFITDEDSIRRFMLALETYYGENAGDIGKDSQTIKELGELFLAETEGQTYKMRRIVETTLSKIRNYSSLYYMEQAGVQTFEIVEAMDNLTCPHCQQMDKRTFEVSVAVQRVRNETQVPYSEIGNVMPFLTTQNVETLRSLSNSDLQGIGFSTPPYHPKCRGRVVVSSY